MLNNKQNVAFTSDGPTTLAQHSASTFLWMFIGLMITAVTAFFFAATGFMERLLMGSGGLIGIVALVLQLTVVVSFVRSVHKMNTQKAKIMFFVYSFITGLTFSVIAYAYASSTIALAFGITAVYFGALATIGYTTRFDLSKFGPILFTSLLILIGFNIFAMFVHLPWMEQMICTLGLIVFSGLTAYDTQKMKALYMANEGNEEALKTLCIYSAFDLYLDFLNIFLYILQMLGRNDD
ncbi:MAG: Bax inhibitor-1/YccA family protein [Erysipelotrichaceae bacterium]